MPKPLPGPTAWQGSGPGPGTITAEYYNGMMMMHGIPTREPETPSRTGQGAPRRGNLNRSGNSPIKNDAAPRANKTSSCHHHNHHNPSRRQ